MVLIFAFLTFILERGFDKIEPEQVWVEQISNSKDPFKENETSTNFVICVKDGYVQYHKNWKGYSITNSCSVRGFKSFSKRVNINVE